MNVRIRVCFALVEVEFKLLCCVSYSTTDSATGYVYVCIHVDI